MFIPNEIEIPSITVCRQGMTVFSKTSYTESQQAFPDSTRADATKHHRSEAWSIPALDLESRALYYNHLLFTTHVVFLQHVRLKPFRPVLHSLTPAHGSGSHPRQKSIFAAIFAGSCVYICQEAG